MKVETKVEEGDPGDVICEMVKVLKADLLVMGCHGYGQFTRYYFNYTLLWKTCFVFYSILYLKNTTYNVFQGDNEECEPSLRSKCELPCSSRKDAKIKCPRLFATNAVAL